MELGKENTQNVSPEIVTSSNSPLQQEGETTHAMLFRENITDQTADIEAYNQYNLPMTWWEKFKASADENFVQQMKRDVFAVQDMTLKFIDAANTHGIDAPFASDFPNDTTTVNSTLSKKELISKPHSASTIRTAKELNDKYQTDKFQFPLDESLAENFLANRKAYDENAYIMQKDGESTSANLLGGLVGAAEPTNLIPTLMGNAVFKGAKLATVIAENLLTTAASETLQQKTKQVAAGVDPNLGEGILNTAVGTVFGTGLHLLGSKLASKLKEEPHDPITMREATEAGNPGHDPNAPKGEGKINNTLFESEADSPTPKLQSDLKKVLSTLEEHGADIQPKQILEDLTPSLKEDINEAIIQHLDNEVGDGNTDFVFNRSEPITFMDDSGEVIHAQSYSSTPKDGFKNAVMTGNKSLEVTKISSDHVINTELTYPKDLNIPEKMIDPLGIKPLSEYLNNLPPREKIKAIKEISQMNEGKMVKHDGDYLDFSNKLGHEGEEHLLELSDSDYEMPKKTPEQIIKEAAPSPHFGTAHDISDFEGFISQSNPELKGELVDLQSSIDEKLKKIQSSADEGFIDKDLVDAMENYKRQKADFKTESKVEELFISCTKGIF